MKNSYNKTLNIIITGMFTALAAVISAIPAGIEILGVPATLQTFAMAFLGFMLGMKNGAIAVFVYILLGLVGIPVYNGFTAGPSILFGITGGFLFGFLALAFMSGLSNNVKKLPLKLLLPTAGLLLCHVIGVLQFALIMKVTPLTAAWLVSIPYLPKDILSVAIAYAIAISIKKALLAAKINILQNTAH